MLRETWNVTAESQRKQPPAMGARGSGGRDRRPLPLRNTSETYGWIGILLHWLTALLVFGLFGLGLYMTSLDYYHPWYRAAPFWHKGLGVVTLILVGFRLVWRLMNPTPISLSKHRWEERLARGVHTLLYLLLLAIPVSGYLVSTADGRPLSVLEWFEIPSLSGPVQNLEDAAGALHYALAWTLIALVALHAAGALKHHFLDRDETLLRLLGRPRQEP